MQTKEAGPASTAEKTAAQETQEMKKEAMGMVARQKEKAATRLEEVSRALHDASQKTGDDKAGRYIGMAAERLDKAASYLKETSATEMTERARGFARRNMPALIGGGLIAGLFLARLAKSGPKPLH